MSAHQSEAFPFDGDVVILDHVHRERPPIKHSNARFVLRYSSLTAVSNANANGDVDFVDLVSESEDEQQDVSMDNPIVPEVFTIQDSTDTTDFR
jgi:hypothetical protein